jgi:hypothetical protein
VLNRAPSRTGRCLRRTEQGRESAQSGTGGGARRGALRWQTGSRWLGSSLGRSSVQRAGQWRRAQRRRLRQCAARPGRAVGVGYLAPRAAWVDLLMSVRVRQVQPRDGLMGDDASMPCGRSTSPCCRRHRWTAVLLDWAENLRYSSFLPNLRVGLGPPCCSAPE